jgi:hypothetical protein
MQHRLLLFITTTILVWMILELMVYRYRYQFKCPCQTCSCSCECQFCESFSNVVSKINRVDSKKYGVESFSVKPSNLTKVKSSVDGHIYYVQNTFESTKNAADTLAYLNQTTLRLIQILQDTYPTDERINRLNKRYNPSVITENYPFGNDTDTSYTINKGDELVYCLRSKTDSSKICPMNTLLFVVLHEMSHVMSISFGHNDEFFDNFMFLLDEADKAGLYNPVDYGKNPQEYCGLTIDHNPMFPDS